jgi:iron complex outermembrane receptor protein
MFQVGQRAGDLQNTFDLPGFVRWDAGLYYRQGSMYGTLYAENIFDDNYAAASVNSTQVYPGAPANVRAMIGFVW